MENIAQEPKGSGEAAPKASSEPTFWPRAWAALRSVRDGTFPLIRDTKWLAAVSVLFSGLLYFPSQVEELYRSVIADADQAPAQLILFYLSLSIVALLIWFGANQVALTRVGLRSDAPIDRFFRRFWPGLLGVIPLISSGLSQLAATPTRRYNQIDQGVRDLLNTPGSVWDKLDVELARSVGQGLFWSGCFTIAIGLLFAGTLALYSESLDSTFRRINRRYFGDNRTFGVTIVLILALAAAFFFSPVGFPQAIGPFGIVTAFALCVVMFTTHVSIITIKYRFPFLPLIFAGAAIFSLADLNDNHSFRAMEQSVPANLDSLEVAFDKWLAARPDLTAYNDEYPVYLVAAQGGGIYAANQTALFLARLQDACPAFKDHLFAISGVSGGSVGAAIFSAGLHAVPPTEVTPQGGPCPQISQFLSKQLSPSNDAQPKPLEKYAIDVLSSDLLSPLMAAAFFTDFSQRFLPFRVPFLFDRASAFEFALEAAGDRGSSRNLLKENYLDHWKPNESSPALVLNATDVGSGRRVIFSPFTFGVANSADKLSVDRALPLSQNDSLVHFHGLRLSKDAKAQPFISLRLSTAAGISARFPWVAPAATVDAENGTLLESARKIRLVDGGYVDNSGVETALDIREVLEKRISEINANMDAKRASRTSDIEKYPRVVLKLIVLGGGNYPTRTSFGLAETAEPIRALLSTRQSRAYVAINRALRIMPPTVHELSVHGVASKVVTSDLRIAKLQNQYYDLPLGWTISLRTRDIIRKQSGRYWDCEFNNSFTQSSVAGVSETDCVQLFVYHELNQSVADAIKQTAITNHYAALSNARPEKVRFTDLQKNNIIRCYARNQTWRLSQSLILHALLDEWSNYPKEDDDRKLAYLLGTAAHETATFRVFSESLSYPSPERVMKFAQPTRRRFKSLDEATPFVNNPEGLADHVYGNRPDLGNIRDGDGWLFRSRGIFPLVGRDNYRVYAAQTSTPLEDEPDLILNRFVGAKVAFGVFFKRRNILASSFNETNEDWVGARSVLPGLPKDSSGVPEGAREVAELAKQIHQCIREAKGQALPSEQNVTSTVD